MEERGVVYRRHVAPYHQPVYAPASQRAYQPTYQPVYRPPYQPSYQPSYQPTYRPPHHSHLDYTQPVYVEERVYPSLPFGARVTYVRGQRCWFYNGSYYRPHPRGTGFTIFIP